jgi:hypothetical protein
MHCAVAVITLVLVGACADDLEHDAAERPP